MTKKFYGDKDWEKEDVFESIKSALKEFGNEDYDQKKQISKEELNNNGWIKIESEADLPKETGHFLVCNKINKQIEVDYIDCDYETHAERWMEFNSHYQPIEKPKPPLY